MKDNRDALDYGEMRVSKLFYKLFFPTLLGLLSSVLLNLADGIFVGQGVGSDALAAINIAAPMLLVSTGIALMFGSGASIVAAVHLSKGNRKAANISRPHRIPTMGPEIRRNLQETKESQTKAKPIL